ncbi:MAG: hypothetical protein WKF35_08340 [Ferruginibacter sp.]
MKLRRNIYLIIGSLLVLINVLSDIAAISQNDTLTGDASFNIGYLIGSHLFLFVGLVFLWFAHKENKKIKTKNESVIKESIDTIGRH